MACVCVVCVVLCAVCIYIYIIYIYIYVDGWMFLWERVASGFPVFPSTRRGTTDFPTFAHLVTSPFGPKCASPGTHKMVCFPWASLVKPLQNRYQLPNTIHTYITRTSCESTRALYFTHVHTDIIIDFVEAVVRSPCPGLGRAHPCPTTRGAPWCSACPTCPRR